MLVPERQCETDLLVAVAYSRYSVFTPTIGPGARVIVRQVIPGGAIGTVVLAHSAPGALTHIRSPAFPVNTTLLRLHKSFVLCCYLHSCILLCAGLYELLFPLVPLLPLKQEARRALLLLRFHSTPFPLQRQGTYNSREASAGDRQSLLSAFHFSSEREINPHCGSSFPQM